MVRDKQLYLRVIQKILRTTTVWYNDEILRIVGLSSGCEWFECKCECDVKLIPVIQLKFDSSDTCEKENNYEVNTGLAFRSIQPSSVVLDTIV